MTANIITAEYCRYSSRSNQREASIEDQGRANGALCKRHGWPVPLQYSDSGISGERRDRPGYTALLADAQAGRFNVLVLWDLKRLSRAEDLPQVMALLKFWGIRVVTCDGFDSDHEGADMRAWFEGMMGNRYLRDLAKATHRGLTGQALAGYSAGGLPYGYKSIHDGHGYRRAIDEEQAHWVRLIFARYAGGHSPRQIAGELNAAGAPSPRGGTWARSAIHGDAKRDTGILNNALYIGQQIWNRSRWIKDPATGKRKRIERQESEWIITEHPDLQIVDQATWNAVKARQKIARRKARCDNSGRGPKYLFSGLLKCGTCNANFVVIDRYRYGCGRHKDRGPQACPNALTVPRRIVESLLLRDIRRDLLSEEAFRLFEAETRRLLKQHQPDRDSARQAAQKAQREVDNILTAIRQGIITPSTKAALDAAEAQLAQAKQELADIETYEPTQILPRAREIYRRMVDQLETIDDIPAAREQLRQIVGDEIRLIPENGVLVAELKGGLAALSQISVVAGARSGLYLTVRQIPLTSCHGL